MPKQRQRYAVIGWCAVDVLEHRPGWTRKQCNEFLEANEDHIQLAMIEAGNAAIRECLPPGNDEDTEEDDE
jgi:hypothetical protein